MFTLTSYFRNTSSIVFFLIWGAFLVCLFPMHGRAETLFYKPILALEQEYTDNILFSRDNQDSDFITTLSPEFSVETKSQRLKGHMTAKVDTIYYHEYDDLNGVEPSLSAGFDYQWSERFSVGANASYLEDSRSDRDTDSTGLVLGGDRERANGELRGEYRLSEVMAAAFSAEYVTEDVADPDSESNDTMTFRFSLSRNISKFIPNTMALFDVSYMNYQSDSSDVRDIDYDSLPDDIVVVIVNPDDETPGLIQSFLSASTYEVWRSTLGFSQDVTERFNFFVKAGISSVSSDGSSKIVIASEDTMLYDTSFSFDGGSTWGWLLFSGMSYKGELDSIHFDLSRDVQTASGVNGTTERSMVSLSYRRRLNESLSLRLSGSAYLNEQERENRADIDELTLNGACHVTYAFADTWSASLGWRYTWIDERHLKGDASRDKNYLFARIVKTFEI